MSCQKNSTQVQSVSTKAAESLIEQDVNTEEVENLDQSFTEGIESETVDNQGSESTDQSAKPTISYTATPDLRLQPEQWQQWPVVPEISPNAVAIYQRGIVLGNDPNRFSKIGDCQSIKEVLLGIYDLPGRYTLSPENEYLQEVIEKYSGSF